MTPLPTPPQAIILAGFDYQGGGVDFARIARNRRVKLIDGDPQITVTILDIGAGVTSTSAVASDAKGRPIRTIVNTTTHAPVTPSNYSTGLGHHARFDTNPAGRMSITDLYAAVEAVGANKVTKGKLVEVSVFSHGFWDGALLVNSDDSYVGRPERDPGDKDSRLGKDFKPPNMTSAQLTAIKAAFAAGRGFWWNWGCTFTESYRQVTHRFINSPLYRKTAPGKLKDGDQVKFDFPQSVAIVGDENCIYSDDSTFFPQATRITSTGDTVFKDLVFTRTVREVKDFFLRGVDDSCHHTVAKATGVPVRGAFLGTYADYEDNDKRIKLPLMNIPRNSKIYGTDFTRYLTMWSKALGFMIEPEGHGYGIYPP
jgi:hypothetical protein